MYYVHIPSAAAPVPENYGILTFPEGKFSAAFKHPVLGIAWTGPKRSDPARAAIDAWVRVTGAKPHPDQKE